VYSYSHQEIRLAFGTWRTQFLAALKIVHAIWLSAGRGHHHGWLASALCRVGLSHCRARLRSRRRSRERPARPDHCSLLPACALCLAAARLANRRVAPGPPTVLCWHLALPRYGRGRAGSRVRVASDCARHRSVDPLAACALEDCRCAIASASRPPCPCLAPAADVPCQGSSFAAAAVRTAIRSTPWGSPWPGTAVPCIDARRRAMPRRVFLCLRCPLAAATFPSNSPMRLHPVPIGLARSSVGQPVTLPAPHSSL